MKRIFTTVILICMMMIASIAWGDIIGVPGDCDTIQCGIDAAVDGDTVLVADGIYTGDGNRDIDFKGKAITVKSEHGAENCIIDCEGDGRGFYFHSGETEESVVSGFTIRNGYADDGGGISCAESSPIIQNNTIKENTANRGGGIYCGRNSSPTIQNNTITANKAISTTYYNEVIITFSGIGGGICVEYSSPTIQKNTITANTATGGGSKGGGIYCRDSSPTIINNTITGNEADAGGGIACSVNSSPTIINNTITGNTAHVGGGIACYGSSPIITNNIITGNKCFDVFGGGIYCAYNSSPTIQNNTITGNTAYVGGGIYCAESSPTIQNNTITGNKALSTTSGVATFGGNGGGIYCGRNSSPTIQKNTIKENSATGTGSEGGGISCSMSSPTIQKNTIKENTAYTGGGISCGVSSPTIQNNTITGNTATGTYSGGGGIACGVNSSPTIINNTITGNMVGGDGGGIYCAYNSSPTITNTILWNDSPQEIYLSDSSITVTYSDVRGGWEGEGNIDVDPLFVDPDNGNYRLSDYSPCIGTGTIIPNVSDTDIEGNPRPNPPGSNPDIGGYENPRSTAREVGPAKGTVSLDTAGPQTWSYTLTHEDGYLYNWTYEGAGITDASVTGEATLAGWTVEYQDATRVTFANSTPLEEGSVSGFEITGAQGGTGMWLCGINSGYIPGPDSSEFTLNLYPGINMISLPRSEVLDTEGNLVTLNNISDLVGVLGSSLLHIIHLADSKFKAHIPGVSSDIPLSGKAGYFLTMASADTLVFSGNSCPAGEIALSKGINLIGLPLKLKGGDTFSALIDSISGSVSRIIYLEDNKFKNVTDDVALAGGMGLMVVMENDGSFSYSGAPWRNEVLASPSNTTLFPSSPPVITVDGTVIGGENGFSLDNLSVTVRHLNSGFSINDNANGKFSVTFIDLFSSYCFSLGDVFEIEISDRAGNYFVDNIRHTVTQEDIQSGRIALGNIIAQRVPKHSQLLANYPNPFNPETWIPYQLAQNAPVTIYIYNTKGQLIHTISLGNKQAGIYTNKSKAAYWDGRSRLGEKVASGVYYYTLKAGEFRATRQMVIVK